MVLKKSLGKIDVTSPDLSLKGMGLLIIAFAVIGLALTLGSRIKTLVLGKVDEAVPLSTWISG